MWDCNPTTGMDNRSNTIASSTGEDATKSGANCGIGEMTSNFYNYAAGYPGTGIDKGAFALPSQRSPMPPQLSQPLANFGRPYQDASPTAGPGQYPRITCPAPIPSPIPSSPNDLMPLLPTPFTPPASPNGGTDNGAESENDDPAETTGGSRRSMSGAAVIALTRLSLELKPWLQPHKSKAKVWTAILERLREKFPNELENATYQSIRNKMNNLIDHHQATQRLNPSVNRVLTDSKKIELGALLERSAHEKDNAETVSEAEKKRVKKDTERKLQEGTQIRNASMAVQNGPQKRKIDENDDIENQPPPKRARGTSRSHELPASTSEVGKIYALIEQSEVRREEQTRELLDSTKKSNQILEEHNEILREALKGSNA